MNVVISGKVKKDDLETLMEDIEDEGNIRISGKTDDFYNVEILIDEEFILPYIEATGARLYKFNADTFLKNKNGYSVIPQLVKNS